MNSALERGKRAEREVCALIEHHAGWPVRRRLAGRADDCGDLEGLPNCCIQVKSYTDITRAVREALDELPTQMTAAETDFGAAFIRRPGGRYFVAMEPSMFLLLLSEATA